MLLHYDRRYADHRTIIISLLIIPATTNPPINDRRLLAAVIPASMEDANHAYPSSEVLQLLRVSSRKQAKALDDYSYGVPMPYTECPTPNITTCQTALMGDTILTLPSNYYACHFAKNKQT